MSDLKRRKGKKMKKMQIVEECRIFGSCYLGEVSFDVLKDTKSWTRFLRKNGLDGEFAITHRENGDHNDGWFLICLPNYLICLPN